MKVVINAGGIGSRISSFAPDIPKPMIKIGNKPILEHQIDCLKKQGFKDFIIITGHLKKQIENYFSDGKNFGVNISYYRETDPLGTAGALTELKNTLKEDFLFIFGDIIFDIDFERFLTFHTDKKADITIFVHPNNHPYDSTIIKTDLSDKIIEIIPKEVKRDCYKNLVSAGMHIISPKIVDQYSTGIKIDFDRDVLQKNLKNNNIYAYNSPEYVKDIGIKERLEEVKEDILSGKVNARNLKNKQKAIFIDRDGTLNKFKGSIRFQDEIELIDGVIDAIKMINKSKYLAIVITNQPVIAKGLCTTEELNNIHSRIETLLGNKGAYLDRIYYCPHHPESGFEGEIKELKIECDCRKPKPGLILRAAQDFNIDIVNSYMVGDAQIDIGAGLAAGCKPVLLSEDKTETNKNVMVFKDLYSFTKDLFKDTASS